MERDATGVIDVVLAEIRLRQREGGPRHRDTLIRHHHESWRCHHARSLGRVRGQGVRRIRKTGANLNENHVCNGPCKR